MPKRQKRILLAMGWYDHRLRQATQVGGEGDLKVYAKPLDAGSLAVGLFNTGATGAAVTANWPDLKLTGKQRVRDLWRQKDIGVFTGEFAPVINSHGAGLYRVSPAK
jgi:alpha-galactosidase